MLKITIVETPAERRFVLEGRLIGPWVGELRMAWRQAHRHPDGRACIVDLNNVTFIDKSGARLLRAIWKKGAQLIAKGVYTKHVLDEVEGRT